MDDSRLNWLAGRRLGSAGALVFVDESGFYLLPGVAGTYGPKGQTPVVDKLLSHDHPSVMAGKKSLVIWDGSPIHRWGDVREFLADGGAKRVHLEAMPGDAPDLSPLDQGCWQQLKHVEMRNLSCMDMEESHLEFHLAIGRLRQKPHLIQSFFAAAGLSIRG